MASYLVRALTQARSPSLARGLCSVPSLKNVTKSNFEPAMAELRRQVQDADFVAIDLEMTGITSAPWRECFEFDRPDIQYLKIKDSAEKFAVLQFGVCPFRWESHADAFVAHPHNFFIFPRQEVPGDGLSSEFLCQTTSLEFLAKYQFDFNTCIYEGISYLSRRQEEEALGRLDTIYCGFPESSSKLKNDADVQLVKMADTLFVERMKIVLGNWRAALLQDRNRRSEFQGNLNDMKQKFQTTFFQMRPALVLNGLTSRQLSLIKMISSKHFKDLAFVNVIGETSDRQPMVVYTDSATDREVLMKEVKSCLRKEAETKIKAAVGFRHVIDLLSSERKLIVGHNCFLDFAHVYSKFIGHLPRTSDEFVSAIHTYFPHIIDTKVLLNSDNELFRILRRGSTSLSKAYNLLCSPTASNTVLANKRVRVEVQVDDQRFSNWNSGAKHEAGYDAFMTGCVFSQACSHLGIDFNLRAPSLDLPHNERLQKYTNHLYLSWVNGDIIDLKTGKSAAKSFGSTKHKLPDHAYSNMIILWGPPMKLRAKDLRNCFSKVFGWGCVTSINQLDQSAAIIQFSKAELVSYFLDLKYALEKDNSPISVLHPMSSILGIGCARYEIYGRICALPTSELSFADQVEAAGIDSMGQPIGEAENDRSLVKNKVLKVNETEESSPFPETDEFVDSFRLDEAQLSNRA